MRISRRATFALAAATLLLSSIGHADTWPSKPVRLIVPFPAGGGTDLISRDLAVALSPTGYTFVVENKPGSGGNLGVDFVSKTPPDGYTLVMGQTSNLAINPTLYAKLPYDPIRSLTPVSLVASAPLVIVTGAASPFKSLADVVKMAREKPDSINFASSGNGTVSHLTMEALQKAAGIKLTHIPYKGASQGLTDVVSGQVQLYVSTIPTLLSQIKAGLVRPIAVTSEHRAHDLPQIPTVAESGYQGFDAVSWFGILGPAQLPKEVVARLNADINKALQSPGLRQKLSDQGAEPSGGSQEEFAKLIRDDNARWGKLVRESGAKID